MSSLPASMKWIRSKATEKRWRHRFPHYKSMGAFCCHGNQSFDPICPKTLCTPVMLHIKFDQDWPTGFRDIQVLKCGRRWTTDDDNDDDDDGRRQTTTDGGPLVYYKLTLWAFGSGELKSSQDYLYIKVFVWHYLKEDWDLSDIESEIRLFADDCLLSWN